MDVTATPRFFKRKLPQEEVMDLKAQRSMDHERVFIFLRENDDSDYPSRIRIILSLAQAKSFAEQLQEAAL